MGGNYVRRLRKWTHVKSLIIVTVTGYRVYSDIDQGSNFVP